MELFSGIQGCVHISCAMIFHRSCLHFIVLGIVLYYRTVELHYLMQLQLKERLLQYELLLKDLEFFAMQTLTIGHT